MLRTLGPNGERREEPETRMQEPAAPKPKMTKRQSTVEYKVEPCKLQLLRVEFRQIKQIDQINQTCAAPMTRNFLPSASPWPSPPSP